MAQSIKSGGKMRLLPQIRVNSTWLSIGLALFALYIIWGSTYLAMRFALHSFAPSVMSSLRFLIAGTLLYSFLRLRGHPAPTRKQWVSAVILGTLLLVIGNTGVAFAEQWIDSGLAAMIAATVPLWTAVFGGIWGQWPRRREWLGSCLGLCGVIVLSASNGFQLNLIGVAIGLVAAISWALGASWSRHLDLPAGLMGSAAEMLCAGGILSVVTVVTGQATVPNVTTESLLALLYLIVFGSFVGFSAFTFLLSHVRPTLATSYAYVNPLVAVGLGTFFANEHITPLELVAMAFILGGVVFVSTARKAPPKAPIIEPDRATPVESQIPALCAPATSP